MLLLGEQTEETTVEVATNAVAELETGRRKMEA